MFGSHKIKIDKALYDRLVQAADERGYSSVQEFVVHLCDRELATQQETLEQEQVERQLRGLGYIE